MMLCGILKDSTDNKIVINLGWVPENYLSQIESVEGIKFNDLIAMIKLPENPDRNTD